MFEPSAQDGKGTQEFRHNRVQELEGDEVRRLKEEAGAMAALFVEWSGAEYGYGARETTVIDEVRGHVLHDSLRYDEVKSLIEKVPRSIQPLNRFNVLIHSTS